MIHTSTGCPALGHVWWGHPGESCLGYILEHHLVAFSPGTLQASTKPKVTFFPSHKTCPDSGFKAGCTRRGLGKALGVSRASGCNLGLNCNQGTSCNWHQGREVCAPAWVGGVDINVFQGLLGVVLGELASWDLSAVSCVFTGNLSALSSPPAIQCVLSPLNEGQKMGISVTAAGERAVIGSQAKVVVSWL